MSKRALLLLFFPLAMGFAGCGGAETRTSRARAIGGDPERGKMALSQYGCGVCHEISGVTGANGRVGPPLAGVAERWYLAGVVPNTPDNMVAWIMDPPGVNPKTAMPNLSVPESVARDMTAYFFVSRL